MRRRQLLTALALSPLAACARRSAGASVRVLVKPFLYMAPVYLASERGHFEREGLDVTVETSTASHTALPLLAGGEADATLYSIHPALLNAIQRGARVRIVAGRQYYAPECAGEQRLIGSRAAFPEGFTAFRQLKGKRIGVSHITAPSVFKLDACLEAGGLSRQDVEVVAMEDSAGAALLTAGKLDVLVSVSDELHLGHLREHIVLGPSVAEAQPGYINSYIVFGSRLLDGDVETGARFVRAYLRGVADFRAGENPEQLLEFVRSNGLDPETPQRLCREMSLADGRIELEHIQRFADWAIEHNLCPGPLRAEELVDMRFLEWLDREAA